MTASTHFDNDLRYRDESDPRQVQLTPAYILRPVRQLFGGTIGLDPCTEPDNPTEAERFYAPPQDGAALPWDADTIFVNPPYGKARERWVRRCIEAGADGAMVVLLMPAHTDTRIFQQAAESSTSMLFVRGRVKFGVLRANRRQAAASHPSVLIGWGVDLSELLVAGTNVQVAVGWNRVAAIVSATFYTDEVQSDAPGLPHSIEVASQPVAEEGERIADANGDELERGDPDYAGQ